MTSPSTSNPTASVRRAGRWNARWILAILVVGGLLAVLRSPTILEKLGMPQDLGWFLDSYAILAANDALAAGLNPYEPNPFDPLKRPHVYSDWWLALGRMGLTRQDNPVFGAGLVLAFLAVALAGARPRSWAEAIGFAAVMLSPPMLLAVNRANNDLVIFSLIGAPLLCLRASCAPWKVALLGAALVIATGLKYYPVVAIAALAILVRPVRRGLWLGGATLLVALGVLWSERSGLVRGAFPLPDSVYLFGSPVIWRELGLSRGVTGALSLSLVGLAATWLVRRRLTVGLGDESEAVDGRTWAFAVGALLLGGCFLAGTSFAYRWVFSLWLLPWLWHAAAGNSRPVVAKITLSLLLLSLWQDGLYCLVLNLWLQRDLPLLDTIWLYFSHTVNWILIALLAGWLLEAGVRAGREARRNLAG